jgi:hypothetical protein
VFSYIRDFYAIRSVNIVNRVNMKGQQLQVLPRFSFTYGLVYIGRRVHPCGELQRFHSEHGRTPLRPLS